MNFSLVKLLVVSFILLSSCGNSTIKANETNQFIQNSDLFWEDLQNGNNIMRYFDDTFFNIENIKEIARRFSECNIDSSLIQYITNKEKIDIKIGLCYELEYMVDMSCGKKKVFITYRKDNTDKIIGLHVESAD